MRIAALYDIHGNLPALDAVLAEARAERVDKLVIGGDALLGPMPRETLARLRELDIETHFIRGNCDREMLAEKRDEEVAVPAQVRDALRWCAGRLSTEEDAFIASWPGTYRISDPHLGDILFCHATPRSDSEIFYSATPEGDLLAMFDEAGADVVVCGHTHIQFDRRVGDTRVVNAGSVGMPFSGFGAYWLLLDSQVELRCTPYDLARAADAIRATEYPGADSFARRMTPPPETKPADVPG